MEALVAENFLINNVFAALIKRKDHEWQRSGHLSDWVLGFCCNEQSSPNGGVGPTCKAWAIVLSMPTSAGDLSLVVRDWEPIGYELLQSLWRDRDTQSSSG